MDAARMELAAKTFEVFETLINIVEPQDSLSSSLAAPSNPKRSYREALRAHLNFDLVSRIIALGRGVQEYLTLVRSTDHLGRNPSPASEFNPDESRLWYEHMKPTRT
jgi:hypothetical protein